MKREIRFACLVTSLTVGAIALGGCAEDSTSEFPSAQADSPIRNGVEHSGRGLVRLDHCSGVRVGKHMVLTAAHCIDELPKVNSQNDNYINRKVSYATGGGWRCLTGSAEASDGTCATATPVYAYRGPYSGGSDVGDDFAALFTETTGGEFPSEAIDGFYTGPISTSTKVWVFGSGYNANDGTGTGVERYMADTVDWVGSSSFVIDASSQANCRGDSGGPVFLQSAGYWQFGLWSEMDDAEVFNGTVFCAKSGAKQGYSRITESKISIINQWRAREGLPACTRHSDAYPNFWVCQ